MGFGKMLGEKLDKRGIKQSDLADGIGITRTTLNSIITRDTSKVEIETFLKICKYINCDPEEFYDEYVVKASPTNTLTINEKRILELFKDLDEVQQENVIARAELYAEMNKKTENQESG